MTDVISTVVHTASKNPSKITLSPLTSRFMIGFEIYSESPGLQQNNLWPQYFDVKLFIVPSNDGYSPNKV